MNMFGPTHFTPLHLNSEFDEDDREYLNNKENWNPNKRSNRRSTVKNISSSNRRTPARTPVYNPLLETPFTERRQDLSDGNLNSFRSPINYDNGLFSPRAPLSDITPPSIGHQSGSHDLQYRQQLNSPINKSSMKTLRSMR
mmetsp:Transcript_19949/g.30726  ORF Transcript_19949/g.30726 Transcript_19949/m.30726 type:complete len:141 (+) Transcript_19949:234-656(+)